MNWRLRWRKLSGVFILVSVFAMTGQSQSWIDTVEPPNWWVGMHHSELQLMIHGDRLGQMTPYVDFPGIRLDRAVTVASENYVFLYLHIDEETQPGTFVIQWKDPKGRTVGRTPYRLEARSTDFEITGYTNADVVCLITPDRFANGDSSNDAHPDMLEGPNRTIDFGRHGGDLMGIEQHLDYLDSMGFTAIWLNPVLENNQPQWSYHGYSTTDYYRVDPRFGSNEDYRQLVQSARDKGMKVIMDMIMNHCGSEHPWMKDLPTRDWVNNDNTFIPTTHRRTSLRDPYAAQSDVKGFADGWFVETMPDLNQRQPLLADYLIQNTLWWIEYLGIGGIRMDTYPYSDAAFMSRWSCAVMDAYPEFNMCGEEWSLNPSVLAYWQAGQSNANGYTSCLPGLLDFPLHDALITSLTEEESWHSDWVQMYEMLGNDYLYPDASAHIIFPDNHDMSRIHTQLGDDVNLTRLATYFFATMRGTPQFYYGTEILMSNTGDDSHGNIRSDLPGGWDGDAVDVRSGRGLSDESQAFQSEFRSLMNWRKTASAIHDGRLMHYVPEKGSYVYFRFNDDQKIMVILNKSQEPEVMDLTRFSEMIPAGAHVVNALTGERHTGGELAIPAWAAWVLVVE